MAGRPKSIDKTRVFDVAKPNKAKPLGTSRPVIVNHADSVVDSSVVTSGDSVASKSALKAPSEGRKIIQPLTQNNNGKEKSDEKKSTGITIISESKETTKEPTSITVKEEEAEQPIRIVDLDKADEPTDDLLADEPSVINAKELDDLTKKENSEQVAEVEPEQAEDTTKSDSATQEEKTAGEEVENDDLEIKSEVVTEEDEKTSDDAETENTDEAKEQSLETDDEAAKKPEEAQAADVSSPVATEVANTNDSGSEKAEVDALAEASQKTKASQKAAEQQAKIDQQLKSLTDSKQYFVPLAHDSSHSRGHRKWGVLALLLLVMAIAAYLAIDFKLVGGNINLPFHFFPNKHETAQVETAQTTTTNDLITLPTSGLKLLYDPGTWTASEPTETTTSSTISLKANDTSTYSYGANIKELTSASAATTDNLTYVTTGKVITGANTDVYFYSRIRTLTSQGRTSYLPECGLGAYPDNLTTGTLAEIPVANSTTVVNISCTFYEKDGTTLLSFSSLADVQSWFSSSKEYQKIKTLLSNFKY